MSATKTYGVRSKCNYKGSTRFGEKIWLEFLPRKSGDNTIIDFTFDENKALRFTRAEVDVLTKSYPSLGRIVILRGLASQPDTEKK